MQAKTELEEYLSNSLGNKLFNSNVPTKCHSKPCVLGIDEAGRGPVLGPMVYAVAYYPQMNESILAKMKFADSKQLTESVRENLFEAIQTQREGFQDLGYAIKILSPNMISNCMLRRSKYNLNTMSHDTAIDLIKNIESHGVEISHIYIDTVGPPIAYKDKLQRYFPKYTFTVTEKADSKYPIVSAASVCAKVMRDRIVNNWKFLECESLHLDAFELGSGYPADPGTKAFLENSLDPVFGYPTLARFSWSTITKILEKKGNSCYWGDSDDEEDSEILKKQQAMMMKIFKKSSTKIQESSKSNAIAVHPTALKLKTIADEFFEERNLSRVFLWN